MHWWQAPFTSSSSSSSSKRHSEDDSVIVAGGRYSLKTGFFSGRRSRNISRSRKLRYASENDVDPWRSPSRCEQFSSAKSSTAALKPQPLPMPELHVLLRKDPKFASPSVPLPSRGANHNQRGVYEEKERERDRERETAETWGADDVDGLNGLTRISRLVGQNTPTSIDHPEIRPFRKPAQKHNAKARSPYSYKINIPTSAPTSPYSSPVLSPPGTDMLASHYTTPPSVFHVWSAPEMPYSYPQTPFEKFISSVDNSPIQSPTVSCPQAASPSSRPASPMPGKISSEVSVHPLPRPPGPGLPSPPTPISPVASRTDFSGASMSSQPTPEFSGVNNPPQLSPVPRVAGKRELIQPIKSRWRKGKLIGRGTFGSVYVASNRETGALCAMKEVEILPDDSNSAERMRQLEQEIKVLSRLKHPNIVQYFGSEIVRDKFYIYLEYVHPGSINKFIQDHCGAITESIVRNFTRHILCGLAYLHSTKTIHRDIKGANLLVDAYGVVKLADFGMAKHLNGEAANLSLKGSPYWLAPELLESVMSKDASSDLALAVDIWSLGCTIIEMMDGKPPWSEYEGAAALFKVLKETPPIPETLSSDGKDFLQCCFRRNPADRPTASKLLDHPFVSYSQQPDACTQSIKELRLNVNSLAHCLYIFKNYWS
ncbi:hypothetical protein OROHE_026254 [Orobanche hederae]